MQKRLYPSEWSLLRTVYLLRILGISEKEKKSDVNGTKCEMYGSLTWVGIAQSVQGLATSWSVRGSYPGR